MLVYRPVKQFAKLIHTLDSPSFSKMLEPGGFTVQIFLRENTCCCIALYGCRNKLPQTQRLKTNVCYLTVRESEILKTEMLPGLHSSWRLQGRKCSSPCPASIGRLHSLVCGPSPCLPGQLQLHLSSVIIMSHCGPPASLLQSPL